MERKLKYQSPAILEELKLEMEGAILTSSVVNEEIEVESVGQEIYDVDVEEVSPWEQIWE